jgi:glycosyltransferase involved in cell wall biosynthesis
VLLSRATAVVLPSRAEGFGLPLLEAMSLGTPTVIADAPALVEVAGGAALVVPREDAAALAAALGRLAADASLRGGLAAAGRRRAAAYSWDDAACRLWTAYAELLAPQ